MINRLRAAIAELHEEFEQELLQKRQEFRYQIVRKRVVFEDGVKLQHRLLRMRVSKFLRESKVMAIVTAPVIYSVIIPLAMLDVFITVYQHICFRVYNIPRVKRGEYVVMDRKYLSYLNWIEKLNCIYCEYGNGVLAYASEVASRTEQFWCPIKHARKVKGVHERYYDFIEYGEVDDFHQKLEQQRSKCRACETPCESHKN